MPGMVVCASNPGAERAQTEDFRGLLTRQPSLMSGPQFNERLSEGRQRMFLRTTSKIVLQPPMHTSTHVNIPLTFICICTTQTNIK